jgi:PAS domain S-box-containing protein
VKKLNQLLIVETDAGLSPLLNDFNSLLSQFSETPVSVLPLHKIADINPLFAPSLLLLHTDLTGIRHLQQFVELYTQFPYSSIIIVSREQEEELCLLALEAGADDSILSSELTETYLRKRVLLSQRRIHTEKALAQSQEQLLACLQATPNVAVQWYNSKSEVLFWNHASERIFGWKANEALGRMVDELIATPGEKDFWRNKMQHLAQTGGSYGPQEWGFRYRDGREGCCISTLVPIPSYGDEPWFVCMDVEITERRQMEKNLRESEEKYRSLIEQQADAIIIFDKLGNILDVNTTATTLLHYSKEEFQQLALADIFEKGEKAAGSTDFALLNTGASTIRQQKMRRKDRSVVATEVHTKRLFEALFLASIRDLTERLEIQNQLQKEIDLSDTIINSLPGLFYLFKKDGTHLRWNKQLETISGYTPEEIGRISPLDFFAGNEVDDVFYAIEKVFEAGSAQIEAYLVTKDGRRIPHYFTGIAIEYAGTDCLLGTGIDLSAMKRLEKELAQQKIAGQKKIMQAMIDAEEKEKGKLGLELHDNVNQILSVVRMYLSILASGKPMPEITLSKAMDLLDTAIAEIRNLSHSLAVSYRFDAGLASTLEDMVAKIQAAKGFSIKLSLSPDLDERISTQQKLAIYRIVQEQLANIIKHAKAMSVSIVIALVQNEIRLEIADNGKGFNPAKAKKGLGLNNMINRAEALAGTATVISKPGKGCRLEVVIPLKEV